MSMTWGQALAVRLVDVSYAYGRTIALNRVNLTIHAGEHVAIIGSNGSGKSTLIRVILGLLEQQHGQVYINGTPNTKAHRQYTHHAIAWMPQRQSTGHFPLLVHELWQSSRNPTATTEFAMQLEVEHLRLQPLHTLSGGQLQRVFLVRALASLAGGSGILLADEPTAALDFAGQAVVSEFIHHIPSTVIVVTHDRNMIQRCPRVLEMAGGQLREVTP